MGDASAVVGKEKSTDQALRVQRVDDLNSFQQLMPYIAHSEALQGYVLKRFRDPDTLILQYGKSCIVCSIIEHDFFEGRIAVLVWAQNPEGYSTRAALKTVEDWARDRGAYRMVSLIGEDGPWDRPKPYMRLTGLRPHRMVYAKEL